MRLLTVIRGNVILEFAKTREGLPELCFGGLFPLSLGLLQIHLGYAHAIKTAPENQPQIRDRDREDGSARNWRTRVPSVDLL